MTVHKTVQVVFDSLLCKSENNEEWYISQIYKKYTIKNRANTDPWKHQSWEQVHKEIRYPCRSVTPAINPLSWSGKWSKVSSQNLYWIERPNKMISYFLSRVDFNLVCQSSRQFAKDNELKHLAIVGLISVKNFSRILRHS